MMELFFPPAASAHAGEMDRLIDLVHVLMLMLFVGWGIFFTYVLFRFRRGRNPTADRVGVTSKSSTYVEVAVAVVEAVLLIGFSIPLWGSRVNATPPDGSAEVVRIVAQQYAWNIWYPGADGTFGKQDLEFIDEETNPLAIDRSDPAAADDITMINQLHLPVNKPVLIHLSSKDVIHSLNLPNMRVKQDAIPGMTIPVWFVPTVTSAKMAEQEGNPDFIYEIACAQLCGNSHYSMRGFLTVHEQADYDIWMAERAAEQADSGGDDFWN
jgi:cytochrome c oxidase subunit 2